MKNNERGGIISKIFVIPIALAFMLGFFVLGYYVGKYQNKPDQQNSASNPLPEIVMKNVPKPDEFTFFKTLTAKDDKTVSLDLKPKPAESTETGQKAVPTGPASPRTAGREPKKEQAEAASGKGKPERRRPADQKTAPAAKKETAPARHPASKLRYSLQLASYQERGMAEDDVKSMKQKGFAAFVVASALPGKGTWYRVRVGSFSNKTSAEKLRKELQAKTGVSSIITIE